MGPAARAAAAATAGPGAGTTGARPCVCRARRAARATACTPSASPERQGRPSRRPRLRCVAPERSGFKSGRICAFESTIVALRSPPWGSLFKTAHHTLLWAAVLAGCPASGRGGLRSPQHHRAYRWPNPPRLRIAAKQAPAPVTHHVSSTCDRGSPVIAVRAVRLLLLQVQQGAQPQARASRRRSQARHKRMHAGRLRRRCPRRRSALAGRPPARPPPAPRPPGCRRRRRQARAAPPRAAGRRRRGVTRPATARLRPGCLQSQRAARRKAPLQPAAGRQPEYGGPNVANGPRICPAPMQIRYILQYLFYWRRRRDVAAVHA
ncbi:MAG: hypothetical protein J3K34DRAFT_169778 [Monoraphidium minutum]|nr:MAG: hypothetical protein J3K34DRAFT_169778 [Monoraphidium minutum]